MEVILIQDVDNLGAANEVVKVRNGYARNFLLPGKLAIENSPSNRKQLEERMKQVKKKEDKMLAEINLVVEKLKEAPIKLGAKTGTSSKIFGSVTTLQISRAIREQKGYDIDRRKIQIPDEVKELACVMIPLADTHLLLPNWIAGLSGLVGFGTLFFARVGREERMMLETFGEEYRDYMARTKRVIPGIY